jgi:class I lanthipeptide synthase
MARLAEEASGYSAGTRWAPILEGRLAGRAVDAIGAIERSLRAPVLDEPASLACGRAGLAVLYAYLAKAGLLGDADETATTFLDQSVEAVGEVGMSADLYGGFTGVAWAVEHLRAEDDGTDPNQDVDLALRDHLGRAPWRNGYDLVSGLVGIGVYALERLPRPGARALLSLVVDRLAETAERSENGVTWLTRPALLPEHQRARCPEGYYNLGLAHGVPGVIALLGGACAAGNGGYQARSLLNGAVAWLRAQRIPYPDGSSFSSWTAPGATPGPARSAWCYGDPGIAVALLCAARAIGQETWEREALSIALRAATRPPDQAGVRDAGLCHGAAGLAHVFNRMHQATGDAGLGEAARFWFTRTLDLRQPGAGIGGFPAWLNGTWIDDAGLLSGAAGVALALVAAVSPIEPAWDRMLLASLPIGTRGAQPARRL